MGNTENVSAWSTTAATNASADAAVNFLEGQDPGTVNDSARSMMAAIAKIEDDRGGALAAGGTANALTVTTNQNLSAGQITAGMRLLVRATAANTSPTVTFAPDGLTAANIKRVDGSALAAGDITPGMYLDLVYNTGSSEWRCLGVPHGYLPLTGGTLTGNLAIDLPSGTSRSVSGSAAGKARWVLELGNATAETGSNVGSDFALTRYNDAGASLGAPLAITRANGNINLNGSVAITNGGLVVDRASGTSRTIYGTAAGSARWLIEMGNATAEGSGNTGADFALNRCSNAGTIIGQPIIVDRSNGDVTLAGNLTVGIQAYKPGGGSWAATSDIRIKNVVGEYERGLEAVLQLRPVIYTYKGNDGADHAKEAEAKTPYVGFIAQELETVFPEMVFSTAGVIGGQPVDDLRSVDVSPLVYALTNAVKELSARLLVLEGKPA